MGRFDGKVAIITGSASGMGRAAAARLAGEGGAVVVADLNVEGGVINADANWNAWTMYGCGRLRSQ